VVGGGRVVVVVGAVVVVLGGAVVVVVVFAGAVVVVVVVVDVVVLEVVVVDERGGAGFVVVVVDATDGEALYDESSIARSFAGSFAGVSDVDEPVGDEVVVEVPVDPGGPIVAAPNPSTSNS
jgi:hypothetical protein